MNDDDDPRAQRRAARRPAGPAGGILGGRFPNVAHGLPMGGIVAVDDFRGTTSKSSFNTELPWDINDIFGAGFTLFSSVTNTATEIGVLRAATGAVLGDGGTLSLPNSELIGGIPVGLKWGTKVRIGPAANDGFRAWSGFADDVAGDWLIAGGVSCVGIRAIAPSGGGAVHWYGVVKDGAGAGNETTVDLGYDADTTWRFLGFRRTTTGIQFCRWDASGMDRMGLQAEDIDDEVTTNIPTADLHPIGFGMINAIAATRNMDIDWWGAGGAIPR